MIPLTERQTQILKLRAEGNTRKEIAHKLGISLKTVEATFAGGQDSMGIHERLGIYDVALLTQWALKSGIAEWKL